MNGDYLILYKKRKSASYDPVYPIKPVKNKNITKIIETNAKTRDWLVEWDDKTRTWESFINIRETNAFQSFIEKQMFKEPYTCAYIS